MKSAKLTAITVFFSFFLALSQTAVGAVQFSNNGNTVADLELALEIAQKDYQLELNSSQPDKQRLADLQLQIVMLRTRIQRLNSVAVRDNSRFGILPEVFEEEVSAALASEDYQRISELLYNLKQKGDEAMKREAASLYELNKKLRFLALENGDNPLLASAINDLGQIISFLRQA